MKNKCKYYRFIVWLLFLSIYSISINAQSIFVFHDFSLSKNPGINQEVKVSCSIETLLKEKKVIARIILPEKAKFISGDSIWTGSTNKGQIINFSANIMFVDTGNFKLELSIKKNYDSIKWAGPKTAYFLHVGLYTGSKGRKRYFNEIERELIRRDSASFFERKILRPRKDTIGENKSKSTINVNGFIKYFPYNSSTETPARMVLVQIYKNSTNNPLGFAYTDNTGEWEIDIPENLGVVDLVIGVISSSNNVELYNSEYGQYETTENFWWLFTKPNIEIGTDPIFFGNTLIDAENRGAMRIYQTLLFGHEYWLNDPGTIYAEWSEENLGGSGFYGNIPPANDTRIYFNYEASNFDYTILHEECHHIEFNTNATPQPSGCSGHHPGLETNLDCAWSEGFAQFFPHAVTNSSTMRHHVDDIYNIEDPESNTYYGEWGNGQDEDEGRVSGALWDIYDFSQDGLDYMGYGFYNIWDIINTWDTYSNGTHNGTYTLPEFWEIWKEKGHNKHYTVAIFEQNTIEYNHLPSVEFENDITLQMNSSFGPIDLWPLTTDEESTDNELEFLISSPAPDFNNYGVEISDDRFLVINPEIDWVGSAEVTILVFDLIGYGSTAFTLNIVNGINPITASFTASPSTVLQGNSVVFTDNSTGDITSWEWVFEDGDPPDYTGQLPPPEINYGQDVEPGPHTATLTISDGTNSDSYQLDIIVEENTGQIIADFSASANSSQTNIPIQFTDQSINNPTSWSWSFDPITVEYYYGTNSNSQNPIVAFTQGGYYDVSLEVSNQNGSDTETKVDFFHAMFEMVQTFYPDFTPKNPNPIVYGNSISFTDLSEVVGWGGSEIDGWIWEFDGGVPSYSFEQNPTILYPNVGIYNVSLKVYNDYGVSNPVYGNVEVYSDDFLLVHLDYYAPAPYPNCPVHFSCNAYGGLGNYKYDWVFGDGGTHTTYSPENTCTWQYQNAQTWFAYVDVQDLDVLGLSQQSDIVEVEITLQPDVTAYFEINGNILQKNEPFKVYDYSVPPDDIVTWSMDFGDGSPSAGWGPDPIEYITHTYEDEGVYDINLHVSTYWYPAIEDDYLNTVQVVDCNNGLSEHCDFSNLTNGWNFPIVAQELVIGGDCPPGIAPVVPLGAEVSLYAPDGIWLKDGFHVTATEGSFFEAVPTCPVNYEDEVINNSFAVNKIQKKTIEDTIQDSKSLNINSNTFEEGFDYDIYPNPTTNKLNIYFDKELPGSMDIELKDAIGKTVYFWKGVMETHKILDLAPYPKGVYLLKIKTGVKVFVEKVIKQ